MKLSCQRVFFSHSLHIHIYLWGNVNRVTIESSTGHEVFLRHNNSQTATKWYNTAHPPNNDMTLIVHNSNCAKYNYAVLINELCQHMQT